MAAVYPGEQCIVEGCNAPVDVHVPGWNKPDPDPYCVPHADELQNRVNNIHARHYWAFTRKLGSKDKR